MSNYLYRLAHFAVRRRTCWHLAPDKLMSSRLVARRRRLPRFPAALSLLDRTDFEDFPTLKIFNSHGGGSIPDRSAATGPRTPVRPSLPRTSPRAPSTSVYRPLLRLRGHSDA
ncbi:MAG: hypothetical protein QOE76_699 [Frankiales bacterium]|nr:hypothetical protein [Frankiales bacterium]